MPYQRDYSKVSESGNFDPVPGGKYTVRIDAIKEGQTKKGYPLVKIREKIAGGEYAGRIVFDQITIFPGDESGAGITKHFLHVIGEPYEGAFTVEPKNWVGRALIVTLIVDEQYNNNKVVRHEQYEDLP